METTEAEMLRMSRLGLVDTSLWITFNFFMGGLLKAILDL
jgi:hypothetical protein